jgi:hypothetical protein
MYRGEISGQLSMIIFLSVKDCFYRNKDASHRVLLMSLSSCIFTVAKCHLNSLTTFLFLLFVSDILSLEYI